SRPCSSTCLPSSSTESKTSKPGSSSSIGYGIREKTSSFQMSHMNDEVRMKGKMIVAIYSMLMSGLCEGWDFKRAEETFREMQSCGHVPNVVTYTTLIRSFAKGGSTLGNRAEVTLVTDNAKVTLNSENAH
ncbi:unnamed protein product, partial [Brassica oleracea var. botrytis]